MSVRTRRVRAVFRKELREYRRNGAIVAAMAIFPLVMFIQPLIAILVASSGASRALEHQTPLMYLLAIPALVPASLASYAVVGERQQGTLEPVLITPIRREEFLLGKALAGLGIWIGIAVSTRTNDVRTAQQLSLLASLPAIAVTSLIAYKVIPASQSGSPSPWSS